MHRFVKVLLLLLFLLGVFAVAAPFLIPADSLRNAAAAQVEALTGRKVTFGKITLSVFPTLALKATNVTISNPAWAGGTMAQVATLRLGARLLPLLHRQVQLTEIVLEDPVINLLQRADQNNWTFAAQSANTRTPPIAQTSVSGEQAIGALPAGITISHGNIIYKDGAAPARILSEANFLLTSAHDGDELKLTGSGIYKGKKSEMTLALQKTDAAKKWNAGLDADFGAFEVSWQGTLSLAGSVPSVTGRVTIPELEKEDFAGEKSSGTAGASSGTKASWSNDPIDLHVLSQINADLSIIIGKLKLTKTTFENVTLGLTLSDGNLSIATENLEAYGGKLRIGIVATGNAVVSAAFTFSDVAAEPLLQDFANFDKFSGTMNGFLHAGSRNATSQRAIVSSLEGSGNFNLKNGVWKSRNILAMARGITQAFDAKSETGTPFTELSGTLAIKSGIASNTDLRMTSTALNSGGAGTLDLPAMQIHYLLKPVIAGTLSVPIRIEGPLDNPRFYPDIKGIILENLKEPGAVKDAVKSLEKNLLDKNGLNNLLR